MCGITGIVNLKGGVGIESASILRAMTAKLAARGPDGEGFHFGANVGLGHRRLSIIDLAGGAQPMKSAARATVITFNGEVYNYRELRRELEAAGHQFRTSSDTEVLLAALDTWGEAALAKLNGDFAFAVWDEAKQQLLLVRDRLGVKPLYYAQAGDDFLFASEPKALLAHPRLSRELDPYALIETLAYLQPLAPRSLFKDVAALEPGHLLVVDRSGVHKRQWWDLQSNPVTDDRETAKRRVRELLDDATRLRMIADVPLCGMLSGGLDSSVLCALMAKHADGPIRTYSTAFDNPEAELAKKISHIVGDDLPFARQVAEALGAKHHELRLSNDEYFAGLLAATRARDLPAAYGSEVGILRLCEAIKRSGNSVALSGEGADEVCLGYYFFNDPATLSGDLNPFFMNRIDRMPFIFDRAFMKQYKPLEYIAARFAQEAAKAPVVGATRTERNLAALHYVQLKFTLPYLLDRADRLSMAASVELRVPFCDHRFVEYFYNLPMELKLGGGMEKQLVRDAFADLLPEAVRERKKSVFPYPAADKDLRALYGASKKALPMLGGRATSARKLFNPAMIRFMLFLAGRGVVPTIASHFVASTILNLREMDVA